MMQQTEIAVLESNKVASLVQGAMGYGYTATWLHPTGGTCPASSRPLLSVDFIDQHQTPSRLLMPDENVLAVDAGRFTGEGSDLSLLGWLRSADTALDTLAPDAIQPHVATLHGLFTRLLVPGPASPATALPKPGRPIRLLTARILVKLHKRVESHALFDLIQALLRGVDGGSKSMSALENVQRVASWYVIGEVIKEHGANVSVAWC